MILENTDFPLGSALKAIVGMLLSFLEESDISELQRSGSLKGIWISIQRTEFPMLLNYLKRGPLDNYDTCKVLVTIDTQKDKFVPLLSMDEF